ncbi:DUF4342 domain-containing protein [Dehalobacter sp. DCM]|uniref:DUF4342 domain-containing protein n=1 Tax=Dehalobacter sp. DCM TaxID=2907827 RepID=UPI003081DAEB|nr:DUF4342 domain-containing protein [Dehalobacter sp. DCM]
MTISLEQIDEMRKRTNCSYSEAKDLLEKNNGDLISAIVEFEKKHGFKSNAHQKKAEKDTKSFGKKVRELIRKGFATRIIIEKAGSTFLNIPLNILIIAVLITLPIIWIDIAAFVVLYLMGYRIRVRKEQGEDVNVNEFVDEISSKVRDAADKMREKPVTCETQHQEDQPESNQPNTKEEKKEDGYNEITIG